MHFKNLSLFTAASLAVFILSGCGTTSTQPTPTQTTNTEDTANAISLEEVAKHATESDCWIVVHGNVYNLTDFVGQHPGGPSIIEQCGKDGTQVFDHRPGSDRPHPARAEAEMAKYKIGVLKS